MPALTRLSDGTVRLAGSTFHLAFITMPVVPQRFQPSIASGTTPSCRRESEARNGRLWRDAANRPVADHAMMQLACCSRNLTRVNSPAGGGQTPEVAAATSRLGDFP